MAKILIIEDQPLYRETLSRLMVGCGHEVEVTGNPTVAFHLFKQNLHDLVMLDRMLPTIGGMTILKHIHETSPSTLVIMLSAFVDEEGIHEAQSLGATAYLSKMVGREALLRVVSRLLADGPPLATAPECSEAELGNEIVLFNNQRRSQ